MTKTIRVWKQSVRLVLAGAAFAACVGSAATASAQSTIFNIPTTDTVSPKKGYFEFDYLVQLPAPDEGQFQVFTPRFVTGITPMMEAGVNFGNVHYADGGAPSRPSSRTSNTSSSRTTTRDWRRPLAFLATSLCTRRTRLTISGSTT
jgi:hypothetical protein